MTWGMILKAAAALAVDLLRDALEERREKNNPGWKYRDVKIANDAAHRAGHEKDPKDAERNPQR